MESLSFRAMNTDFFVAGIPKEKAEEVRCEVEQAEKRFSRFNPDSEISRLTAQSGGWVSVSSPTYDLLHDAVIAFQTTEGLFNPFLGNAMQAIGYDRSFEKIRSGPAKSAMAKKQDAPTTEPAEGKIEMNPNRQTVRLEQGIALDLGGLAKGWTAQRAADRLMAQGVVSGLIDAGGDIVLWGNEPEQGLWGIGAADPLGGLEDIAVLWCEGLTAMATSSVVKRSWQRERETVHHIIDPRTGEPAVSDLLQVTVLSRDLVTSEQYAKCLIVLGSMKGFSWLAERRPDIAYIAVLRDGTVHISDNIGYYAKEWEVKKHVECSST